MKNHVRLDGLLFSNDTQVLSVMNQVLGSFAIDTEVCSEFGAAINTATHRGLDAVIVDWNAADNPTRVVSAARKSSPNANSTIVAMVNERSEMQAALLAGANFIIHKPASHDHVARCMRAAYGTMLQQRRKAARCTVDIPVAVRVAELGRLDARISNISVGGLALHFKRLLEVTWTVSLSFTLPNTNDLIPVIGRVVNANTCPDGTGRIGICFSFVPEDEFDSLVNWLASELTTLENAEIPVSDALDNSSGISQLNAKHPSELDTRGHVCSKG